MADIAEVLGALSSNPDILNEIKEKLSSSNGDKNSAILEVTSLLSKLGTNKKELDGKEESNNSDNDYLIKDCDALEITNNDVIDSENIGGVSGAQDSDTNDNLGVIDDAIKDDFGANDDNTKSNSNDSGLNDLLGGNISELLGGLNLGKLLGGNIEGLISALSSGLSASKPLLLAIKPFLNKNRQELIDTILKLSSIASIANLIK